MNREQTIPLLKELGAELADKYGVLSLSLFGSVCRDEAGPSRDVDPLVEFDCPVGYFGLFALRYLVLHGDKYQTPAWKSFGWDTIERLHVKDLTSDPKSKAKSVALSDDAVKLSESLFKKHFGTQS
jgi:predicted nucleotidyltransferase